MWICLARRRRKNAVWDSQITIFLYENQWSGNNMKNVLQFKCENFSAFGAELKCGISHLKSFKKHWLLLGRNATIPRSVFVMKLLSNTGLLSVKMNKCSAGAKGTSDEYEKVMIGRLKQECGAQFVSKLEGMFTHCLLLQLRRQLECF